MKKTQVAFKIIGMVILSFCAISIGAAQDNFSGTWVLDKAKTRDLPSGLKSYTMVVTQNEQKIVVETKVEGDLRLPKSGPSEGPPEMPAPINGPAGGMEGGFGGSNSPGAGLPSGALALRMVDPETTYSLDGKETQSQVETPKPSTLKLKAKWAKDKKSLELSSVLVTNSSGNNVRFTKNEKWTLSEGGQVLKIQRSVDTPRGMDTIKLIFQKGTGDAPTAQP